MENKYMNKWNFFEEVRFLGDLVSTIEKKDNKNALQELEKLLIDGHILGGMLDENVFVVLMRIIKLASKEYTVDDLEKEYPAKEDKEERF